MRRALLTVTCGAALLMLHAPAAFGMGFGRTVTTTTLGQTLNFAAIVALDVDESLARECVGAEVLIGDAKVAAENVRITLESVRETGERRVRVTTRVAVDEPVVTVVISVGCQSQVSRRFVAFIDPPMLNLASAEIEALPPQRVDNQVAPLLDIVRAAQTSRREAPVRKDTSERLASSDRPADQRRAARSASRVAASPVAVRTQSVRQARATTPRSKATVVASSSGDLAASRTAPRLRLDAASGLAAPDFSGTNAGH